MKNLRRVFVPIGVLLLLALFALTASQVGKHEAVADQHQQRSQSSALTSEKVDQTIKQQVFADYGKLPMRFEANAGQLDEQVKFFTRGNGYTVFLTDTEMVMSLRSSSKGEDNDSMVEDRGSKLAESSTDNPQFSILKMSLAGVNATPTIIGQDELRGKTNYLKGNDRAQWRTHVPNYKKIHYEEVYPGIDLVYYGNQQRLEYDFVVQPSADPTQIEMQFDGLQAEAGKAPITLDENGNAILQLTGGKLVLQAPIIYQEIDGERELVDGAFHLKDNMNLAFALADYDDAQPLVIDPVLLYSTFLGGSGGDYGYGIAVDAIGNAYVTGSTQDATTDFPSTSGAFSTTHSGGGNDVFVSKLSADGTSLLYSTFLGGTGNDLAYAIAVDADGYAYLTGSTGSSDFPTTIGAYDVTHNGISDAFVAKLDPAGTGLVYSTFLGGSSVEEGWGVAVDASGNAYVAGYTNNGTTDFPTTVGAFSEIISGASDAFVSKLNSAGTALIYSTFLGGSGDDAAYGLAVDASGSAYVAGATYGNTADFPTTLGAFDETSNGGTDAFVSKLNPSGTALTYSTLLGGSSTDEAWGIAVDASGNAFVAGYTFDAATDFPTTSGAYDETHGGNDDVFVSKLNPTGSALIYSTFLGGSGRDDAYAIAVDASGNAYVTGETADAVTDFPTTPGAFDETHNGARDAFVSKLSADGSDLLYSTFLGGSPDATSNGQDEGWGIAVDGSGNAYVTGSTVDATVDFATTSGAFDETHNGSRDAFVAKFGEPAQVLVTVRPSSLNGWASLVESGSGTVDFVTGPGTPPLSAGSAEFSLVDATSGVILGTADFAGTKLASIYELQYSTYNTAGNSTVAPALQINIDYDLTDATTSWQGRLVFEPYYDNTIVDGTWQTWNPRAGRWWQTGTPVVGNAVQAKTCPQGTPCSWENILATYPNAGVQTGALSGILFKAGSGWFAGYQGSIDEFIITVLGTRTIFDFDPVPHKFALLATESIELDKYKFVEGDMHANGDIEYDNGRPSTHTGSAFAVGKITINRDNTITGPGDLTAGSTIKIDKKAKVHGTIEANASVDAVDLPTLSYSCSGANGSIIAGKDKKKDVASGDYNILRADKNAQLNLSAGEYSVNSLVLNDRSRLYVDVSGGEVIINVCGEINFIKNADIIIVGGTSEDLTINYTGTKVVVLGKDGDYQGNVIAPNAEVELGSKAGFLGAICAKSIVIEKDARVRFHGLGAVPKSVGDDEEKDDQEEVTSPADAGQPVTSYALEQNYPNPFNPSTTISFALPEASDVTLSIFNTNGQLVKKLVAGAMSAGRHNFTWDATNERGERVASGVYLYVIKAGPSTGSGQAFTAQRKLVLMK